MATFKLPSLDEFDAPVGARRAVPSSMATPQGTARRAPTNDLPDLADFDMPAPPSMTPTQTPPQGPAFSASSNLPDLSAFDAPVEGRTQGIAPTQTNGLPDLAEFDNPSPDRRTAIQDVGETAALTDSLANPQIKAVYEREFKPQGYSFDEFVTNFGQDIINVLRAPVDIGRLGFGLATDYDATAAALKAAWPEIKDQLGKSLGYDQGEFTFQTALEYYKEHPGEFVMNLAGGASLAGAGARGATKLTGTGSKLGQTIEAVGKAATTVGRYDPGTKALEVVYGTPIRAGLNKLTGKNTPEYAALEQAKQIQDEGRAKQYHEEMTDTASIGRELDQKLTPEQNRLWWLRESGFASPALLKAMESDAPAAKQMRAMYQKTFAARPELSGVFFDEAGNWKGADVLRQLEDPEFEKVRLDRRRISQESTEIGYQTGDLDPGQVEARKRLPVLAMIEDAFAKDPDGVKKFGDLLEQTPGIVPGDVPLVEIMREQSRVVPERKLKPRPRTFYDGQEARKAEAVQAEPPPPPGGEKRFGEPIPMRRGKETTAFDVENNGYRFDYAYVNLDDIVTSHDANLRPMANFPPELQGRDRGARMASEYQVDQIAQRANPDLLFRDSPSVGSGPIVIGEDGIAEVGRGRLSALLRMKERYPDKWAALQARMGELAENQGLTPQDREAFGRNAVLVRVRKTPVDRVKFTTLADKAETAKMAVAEQAASDARNLTDEALAKYASGEAPLRENLTQASNRNFVRAFANDNVSIGEQGGFMAADGAPSIGAVERMAAALLNEAYDNPKLTQIVFEAADSDLKRIALGLEDAAPKMIALERAVQAGQIPPQSSIRQALRAGIDRLLEFRAWQDDLQLQTGRRGTWDDYAREGKLSFADSAGADAIAKTLLEYSGSAKKIRTLVDGIADYQLQVAELNKPVGGLFGNQIERVVPKSGMELLAWKDLPPEAILDREVRAGRRAEPHKVVAADPERQAIDAAQRGLGDMEQAAKVADAAAPRLDEIKMQEFGRDVGLRIKMTNELDKLQDVLELTWDQIDPFYVHNMSVKNPTEFWKSYIPSTLDPNKVRPDSFKRWKGVLVKRGDIPLEYNPAQIEVDVRRDMLRKRAHQRQINEVKKMHTTLQPGSFDPLNLPKGYKIVYLDGMMDFAGKQTLEARKMRQVLRKAESFEDVLEGMADAMRVTLTAQRGPQYAIPTGIANMLERPAYQVPMWLRALDIPTNLWRVMVLAFRPAWFVYNQAGNVMVNLLAGNVDPRNYFQAMPGLWRDVQSGIKRTMAVAANEYSPTGRRLMREAQGMEAVRMGVEQSLPNYMHKTGLADMERRGARLGELGEKTPWLLRGRTVKAAIDAVTQSPAGRAFRTPATFSFEMNGAFERFFRNSMTAQQVKKLEASRMHRLARYQRMAKAVARTFDPAQRWAELSPDDARKVVSGVNDWMFDYQDLGPFERAYIRRGIPFYTWTKNVIRLAATLPIDHPLRTRAMMGIGAALQDVRTDEDLPERLQDSGVVVDRLPNGDRRVVDVARLNIFETLRDLNLEGMIHPLGMALIEALNGKQSFTGEELDADAFRKNALATFLKRMPENWLPQYRLFRDYLIPTLRGQPVVQKTMGGKVRRDESGVPIPGSLSDALLNYSGVPIRTVTAGETDKIVEQLNTQRKADVNARVRNDPEFEAWLRGVIATPEFEALAQDELAKAQRDLLAMHAFFNTPEGRSNSLAVRIKSAAAALRRKQKQGMYRAQIAAGQTPSKLTTRQRAELADMPTP